MLVVETGGLWERGQLGRSSRRRWEMDMNMVDQFIWWLIAKGVHISSVCILAVGDNLCTSSYIF